METAPKPPDLRELGDRYRTGHDPAAVDRRDPWMHTMPCENGVIYVHGVQTLGVECRGVTAMKLLRTVPGVALHQQGDHEWAVIFPLDVFEQVAAIVKPRKRRTFTQEQKTDMVERLNRYRAKNQPPTTTREMSKDASGAPKAGLDPSERN